jgi:uncharacterized protein (DUF433 family)
MRQPLISSSPDVMGGTPVFAGTRVPVQTLLDYLEGGETIDDFLEGFPTVRREQVIAFLEEAKARMVAAAS